MADLPLEIRPEELPGIWAGIVARLQACSANDRLSLLRKELASIPGIDPDALLDQVFAIDPRQERVPEASRTPFHVPHTLIDVKREMGSSRLETLTLGQILAMKDLKIEWCVDRLIPKEGVAIIGGPPGKGKSWALLDLALACISGGLWMNRFRTQRGRVLYVDEENPPALVRHRLCRLLKGWNREFPDTDLCFALGQGLCLARSGSLASLHNTIEALKPSIVIVDSLIRVHGTEENSASEMARVFAGVKDFVRRFHCTAVFADHQKKPGMGATSQDLLLRGTTEKVAFVDTLLSLYEKDGALIVEHSKSRFAQPVPKFVIAIEDPEPDATTIRVIGDAEEIRRQARLEHATGVILGVLAGGTWIPRKQIVAEAKKAVIPARAVDEVLKLLLADGALEREDRQPEGRGGKAAHYRLTRPHDPVSRFTSIIYREKGNGVVGEDDSADELPFDVTGGSP
jgi:hypothetical protein